MRSRKVQHVLHVTYDMRIGGTEQVIRNLIESSDANSVRMSIFCIEEPLGPWGKDLRSAGIDIHCYPRRAGFDVKLTGHLRKHITTHGVDVVHCHQYTPWVYGALAAAGTATKVIFTEHGRFYPDSASPKRRYINPVLSKLTNQITAISAATKQALVDYEYLSAERVEVIYNGIRPIDSNSDATLALRLELGIPSDAPVLGTIARFDPIKNHQMMLEAFRLVLDQHPKCYLLLVGDGEERGAIEESIESLGLGDRVMLPGYIAAPNIWLQAMNIFLLSSFSEGTSMTLLEAMSLGKPCVVTAVGGNPEIILDGETGYVSANNDAQAFAASCSRLLSNPIATSKMATAAKRTFALRFDSKAMCSAYGRLYSAQADH